MNQCQPRGFSATARLHWSVGTCKADYSVHPYIRTQLICEKYRETPLHVELLHMDHVEVVFSSSPNNCPSQSFTLEAGGLVGTYSQSLIPTPLWEFRAHCWGPESIAGVYCQN